MKVRATDADQARRALPEALRRAAAHLRERGNFDFLNDDPDICTTDELANLIEQAAERLVAGDDSDGRRLWRIFAPTCTWDDAGGDSRMGQETYEMIDSLIRPS